MGYRSDDDASRGQSLLPVGSLGCEYADVVWRGDEGISPTPAGIIRTSSDQRILAWDPLSILERSLLVIQPFSGAVLKWSSWILTDASNLLKMTFQEKSCT